MAYIASITIDLTRLALLFAVVSASAMGCDEPAAEPGIEPAVEEVEEVEEAAEAAPLPAPSMREHESTNDAALGSAPDGFALDVGADAPAGSATTVQGDAVTLASLYANGPVLLAFYRGGWCPYCNFQVRSLTESYDALQERGVTPVLVSVDRQDEATRTNATYEIPFPVLSDPDLALHRAFGVVHEADDEEVARLAGFGHDIEAFSGREHHSFAIPSIFVIDGDGKVRWLHVDPAYRVRPSVAQLLGVLDELALSEEVR